MSTSTCLYDKVMHSYVSRQHLNHMQCASGLYKMSSLCGWTVMGHVDQILLRKLQCYGIRGIACDWFKSYLENRVQYVSYNTKDSDYMKIMCGVPQGSILGPLLFILYINDIVKVSTVLNPVLFADDTSLFHAHTDFDTLIKEINEELQKVTTWFHTNKLSLNIKKSNFIMFLPKGKNTTQITLK